MAKVNILSQISLDSLLANAMNIDPSEGEIFIKALETTRIKLSEKIDNLKETIDNANNLQWAEEDLKMGDLKEKHDKLYKLIGELSSQFEEFERFYGVLVKDAWTYVKSRSLN